MSNAVGDGASFPRSRPRDDAHRSPYGRGGRRLFRVEIIERGHVHLSVSPGCHHLARDLPPSPADAETLDVALIAAEIHQLFGPSYQMFVDGGFGVGRS